MKILSIGRGDDCNIILSDNMISRRHAVLKIYATGKMELVDMGQNGTFVNGFKLTPNVPYPVSRKDVVSFAHVRQLDWSQVPDNLKVYRYALIGVGVMALIAATIIMIVSLMDKPTPPYDPKESPTEKLVPAESEEKEEEKKKEETEAEKTEAGKKKKTPTPADLFPKRKEQKKSESKKDTIVKPKPAPKEESQIIM